MTDQKHGKRVGKQSSEAADQTKQEIMKAALHCFSRQGFNSTSLRDIAERSNTTHGLIRHHYGSKDNLWRTCIVNAASQFADEQLPLLQEATAENARESLEEVIRVLIKNAASAPDLWRLMAFEALKDSDRLGYLLEILRPFHERVTPLIKLAQDRGELSHFDPESLLLYIICVGVLPSAISPFSLKMCNIDMLSPEQAEKHANLVIHTLFSTDPLTTS
jgi:TetR/AcrR family transcriptional regulator